MAHPRLSARHDAAIGAPPFFGEPVEIFAAACHFHDRLLDRLALFQRGQAAQHRCTFAQQVRRAAQNGRTINRGGATPHAKPLGRSVERFIQIGPGRHRHAADFVPRGRIEHRQRVALAGIDPATGDEQLRSGVILISH